MFSLALMLPLAVGSVAPAVAAVRTCSSSTPQASRPLLRQGDTGSCVKVLQNMLIAKGYSPGSADGVFGPNTDLAVRRYQSAYGGLTIDGVVGQGTWGQLLLGTNPAYTIGKGPNRTSRVVLSFDDCPPSYAAFQSAVLGAEALGIRLVLFPTGDCLSAGLFSASYARAHGHYVFNHSVSHPNLTTLSFSAAYGQLGAPGVTTNYGRPPYGAYDTLSVRNAYAKRGMRVWTWTKDTNDWTGKTQAEVVSYVVGNASAGDTVLMHMSWNAFNKTALAQMKSGLTARGLGLCRNTGAVSQYPSFAC